MRTSIMLGLLVVLAVVAGACSSEGEAPQVASLETTTTVAGSEAEPAESDPTADLEDGMLAFTQCVRDQGIEVDDPKMGPDGMLEFPTIVVEAKVGEEDPEAVTRELEETFAQCEQHLEGVVMNAPPGGDAHFEDVLLEYAACMRDNGVDMPDPDIDGNGGVIDLGDMSGEDFEAADANCSPLLSDLGLGG